MNRQFPNPARAALVLGSALLALFTAPHLGRAETIRIGIVNSLSGYGADMGLAGRQGASIAVDEINNAGGVRGNKIELVYRDDEGNPAKAVAAVNELIFKQNAKVIMGANFTHVANAINGIINKEGVVFITLGTGNTLVDAEKYPYTFRLNVSTAMEADALVKFAIRRNSSVGIIRDATAFGQTGSSSILASLKNLNVEPLGHEIYNVGDTDMTAQMLKLKGAGAKDLIAWCIGPDCAQLTRSLDRVRWYPHIISGVGVHQVSFKELCAPKVAENWLATITKAFTYPAGGKVGDNVQKFIDKVKSRYGADTKSYVPNAGIWYDMILLYAKAVEKAGSQDPKAIKAALEETKGFKGLASTYNFAKNDHDGFDRTDVTIAYALRGDAFAKERVEGQ